MKTNVKMKRLLFGEEISQMSKSEFFSATELVKSGNRWRYENNAPPFNLSAYLKSSSTISFIDELNNKFGSCVIKGRGKLSNTYVHPLLFIDIALAISPKLKIEVYEWLFDNLIKYRNISGDSYKEMSAALWQRCTNTRDFPKIISSIALRIKESCKVSDWETASEEQLERRDKIHNSIKLLTRVLTDIDQIVRIAIEENMDKSVIPTKATLL
jgi:hypothetical protein